MKEFWNLDKNLQLRLGIVFLGAFSYGTVFSSMTIYYNQHLGSAITGILLALSAVATFVAGILAGFFADRNGRKPVMVFGTVIQLLGALLAIASNLPGHVNPWSTFIAFLLISFGYNLVITAGNAMIIDASNAENRKVVFMLDYWAQNLSVILGAALSAWLFRPAFEALLVILLLTVLVSFFLTTFVMTETFRPIVKAKEEAENIFQAYKTVLQDKTYMIFMGANIATTFIIMQFDNFLPVPHKIKLYYGIRPIKYEHKNHRTDQIKIKVYQRRPLRVSACPDSRNHSRHTGSDVLSHNNRNGRSIGYRPRCA